MTEAIDLIKGGKETPSTIDTPQLMQLMDHANKCAVTLFSFVFSKEFTLHDVRTHNKCSYENAKEFILFLNQYGYITEKKKYNRSYFKMHMRKEDRVKNLLAIKMKQPDLSAIIDKVIYLSK